MGNPGIDSVFPQRLTPFEYYFYADERPGYPAVFPIRLEWQGKLDRAILDRAYAMAHARHPLLSARVADESFGRPLWVAGEPTPVHWDCDAKSAHDDPLFLQSCGGVRLFVRSGSDGIAMSFVFHHAVVDGLAAFQFIKDLLLAYDHLCADRQGTPQWARLKPAQLHERDKQHLFRKGVRAGDLVRVATTSLRVLLQRPAVVASKREAPRAVEEGAVPRFRVEHLGREETAELNSIAREQRVMLNDLLLRDLFLALAAWNAETSQARYPIRMLLPTNLRRREVVRMPAANMFGYAFLTRSASEMADRERLLHSLQDETVAIKRERRALYFDAGLRLFTLCPPLLRWSMRRPWPFATAVFSNLGTSFDHMPLSNERCGGLHFMQGAGAPTIRPDTRAAFAVHTYSGRMAVSLRCDPLWFDDDDQQAMLAVFLSALKSTLETRS